MYTRAIRSSSTAVSIGRKPGIGPRLSPLLSLNRGERVSVRDIIAVTSGCPQDNPRTPLGRPSVTCRRHVPVVYSLHDPRGLTSSRIRLSHQSILFHNRVLIAPCLQVPLT